MSDDISEKFKQITELLGQNSSTNIPDNVKGLLNMLMSSNNTKEEGSPDDGSQRADSEPQREDADEMVDMTRKMKKAINLLNTANDPRVNLLNAIKPYLNKNRQKKLQTCMKLIKIGGMTKLMDDLEGRSV